MAPSQDRLDFFFHTNNSFLPCWTDMPSKRQQNSMRLLECHTSEELTDWLNQAERVNDGTMKIAIYYKYPLLITVSGDSSKLLNWYTSTLKYQSHPIDWSISTISSRCGWQTPILNSVQYRKEAKLLFAASIGWKWSIKNKVCTWFLCFTQASNNVNGNPNVIPNPVQLGYYNSVQ